MSPVATVTQTAAEALVTITDATGTTTATLANGAKGDTGETGPQGLKGDTGERGPQGIQFSDIADAIRGQNGLSVTYAPGDMAQAILDLVWDLGVKVRAMLLTDGTLEFNYRDGRSSDLGTIAQCWEVDPAGYSSDSAQPWHAAKAQVRRVVFDSDFSGAGMTNFG